MTTAGGRHDAAGWLALAATATLAVASGWVAVEREQATGRAEPWIAALGVLSVLALGTFLRGESLARRHAAGEARRLAGEADGRREAERALRDGERRFREVVEAAPVALLRVGRDGRITLANPQAGRLFGWAPDALLGREVEALLPDGLRDTHAAYRESFFRAPQRRRVGEGGGVHGLRRDGTRVPIEIGLSPIGPPGEGTVLASIVDLSARDAEQRQLESMLREKTVLLDEVHHRVKNNLQVITSLLSLQARTAPPEARAALAECRNRVHAMALTHQLLHENADVARLHFGEYLTRLGRMLADAHRAAAPRVALRVEGAEVPLYLALPRAIPCGLLVTELVTHAYRHAFAPEGTGTIVVGLAIDGDRARVWVADDGVAAPDDGPPDTAPDPGAADEPDAARPLAWQLVPLLVEQLGGRLARGPGPGTRFDVSFPVDDGARR